MFDFPQAQYTFLAILSFIGIIYYFDSSRWEDIIISILLAVMIIFQLWIIIPYTYLHPKQVKNAEVSETDDSLISILVINVYQYNTDYTRCMEVVTKSNPDIVLAVETDTKWQKAFSQLDEEYKYQKLHPLDNTYGMLLYSRLPLEDTEIKFLIEEGVPSIHTYVRLRSGKRIKLYGVHPQPPSPTENDRSTERDAELFVVGKEARNIKEPVIVAGDLNDVAWSKSTRRFQRISGLLDPRVGRGFYNTFHAKYPIMRWPLDHVFHSNHFTVKKLIRLDQTGSDHFPMFIQLYCNGQNTLEQEKPQPDHEDREEAEESIDKAREDDNKD